MRPALRRSPLSCLPPLLLSLAASACGAAPPPLPALGADLAQTSVSGISSGGFMAVQFQVAHSAIVKGAGIVAAGPFWCAQGSVTKAAFECSCTGEPRSLCKTGPDSAAVPALVAAARKMHADGRIDDPANLGRQRVVSISGGKDELVPKAITAQLEAFYAALGMTPANFVKKPVDRAGHTMPTPAFGEACGVTESPYIGKCGVDAAKEILEGIYGPLQPRSGAARGRFVEFDQKPYLPPDLSWTWAWRTGLDSSGWAYIPDACKAGGCRVHVALHGCKQGQSYLPLKRPPGGGLYYGTTFVRNSGYDRWADANRIVVLFPQATSIPGLNPNGCWDWWGFTGDDYATQKGVQVRAIRAMVGRLAAPVGP